MTAQNTTARPLIKAQVTAVEDCLLEVKELRKAGRKIKPAVDKFLQDPAQKSQIQDMRASMKIREIVDILNRAL